MNADFWLKIGPLLGGGVVLCICFIYVLRNPNVSNAYAGLLAFGGLLFAIPTFASIDIDTALIKIKGQVARQSDSFATQVGELKSELVEIRQILQKLGKVSDNSMPSSSSAADILRNINKGSRVLIVYSSAERALARKLETQLLNNGYAANAVFSDFSELDNSKKESANTARFVFTERTKPLAESLKKLLAGTLSSVKIAPDEVRVCTQSLDSDSLLRSDSA